MTARRAPVEHAPSQKGEFAPFRPPIWLRGGHAQTVLGRHWPGNAVPPELDPAAPGSWTTHRRIDLEDGDALIVADTIPPGWDDASGAVLMVHGLGGDERSPYVARVATRLARAGRRVARLNLRGAGPGFGLARKTYHAGLTEDLRAVLDAFADPQTMPDATSSETPRPFPPARRWMVVGFSLGANLTLKLAAEAATRPIPGWVGFVAANPPLDLAACCRHLRHPFNRFYDWNFTRQLKFAVERLHQRFPDLGPTGVENVKGVFDFDEAYTAPRHGFRDAEDYYARSSAGFLLDQISLPGLVIHAWDDPFIPEESQRSFRFPGSIEVVCSTRGGHLGYIADRPVEGTRRWLDARITHAVNERFHSL